MTTQENFTTERGVRHEIRFLWIVEPRVVAAEFQDLPRGYLGFAQFRRDLVERHKAMPDRDRCTIVSIEPPGGNVQRDILRAA